MAASGCKTADSDHYDVSIVQETRRQSPRSIGTAFTDRSRKYSRSSVLLGLYALRSIFLRQLWQSIQESATEHVLVARLYFSFQALLFVADIIQTVWRLFCNSDVRRPRLRLIGSHVPLVDIVITTCGEDHDIILDTVRACLAADYPISRRRVLVSDDAADDELRQQIQDLSINAGLHYFTRNSRGMRKPGAKAGNMNAALAHLDAENEGVSYPYVVFIDADMIVEPEFLRAELAHMLTCSTAGLCILPQNFYNVPKGDPLGQSLQAQQQWDEILRDSAWAAWNSGSSALMRRSALAEIGGVPESALTEDVLAGVLMQGRGWHVIYCNEPLQWGLVPETSLAHIKQRVRWSVGAFRNAKHHVFGTSKSLLPDMTRIQSYLAFTEGARCWFSTPVDILCRWSFLLLVATGQPLIAGQNVSAILRTYSALVMLVLADEILSSANAGYTAMRKRDLGHAWLSPYLATAFLKELLPSWMGGFQVQFVPTGISESALMERKPGLRASLSERVDSMILQHGLWYHLVMSTVAVAVCSTALQRCITQANDNEDNLWQLIFQHALVPGFDWDFYLVLLQPVLYAIWPPTMPPRRELLQRTVVPNCTEHSLDPKTGGTQMHVWHPKPEAKDVSWDASTRLMMLPHIAGQLFWAAVGVVFLLNNTW